MKRINVTEPFLPPLEEYVEYLKAIWDRNWLTNQGPLVQELEAKLQAHHQIVMPVHCVANGGLGLQIILKAMGIGGEIITTPFSYVATTSCPVWEGCTVKFADIEPEYLTIAPSAVEAAITPRTEAILATHVFGNPCDVEALEAIARKHGVALVFDAAHAIGVRYKGKSILEYGDASMVSLHATKLFHTVEGGFVVAKDPAVAERVEWMRRFGHNGMNAFHGVGINAKMSEFHAAMGLCNLNYLSKILSDRERVCMAYKQALAECDKGPASLPIREATEWNNSYYPVLFETGKELKRAFGQLAHDGIAARRYFYPVLSKIGSWTTDDYCSFALDIASRILCLPLSSGMSSVDVERVVTGLNGD